MRLRRLFVCSGVKILRFPYLLHPYLLQRNLHVTSPKSSGVYSRPLRSPHLLSGFPLAMLIGASRSTVFLFIGDWTTLPGNSQQPVGARLPGKVNVTV